MEKNQTLYNMCKGTGSSSDCGLKYWVGWERGQLGATAPAKPILKPEQFCVDKNSRTELPCKGCNSSPLRKFGQSDLAHIRAYRSINIPEDEVSKRLEVCEWCPLKVEKTCEACGCDIDMKVSKPEESCPIYKWTRYGRKRRPFDRDNLKVNIIMHLMPLKKSKNWMTNLDQLAKRYDLFNNSKYLAICFEDDPSRPSLHTEDPEVVIEYCNSIGLDWTEIKVFKNNPKIREGVSFPWLLESIKSVDPNEITFFCHGKSSTHHEGSICDFWRDTQYLACLDRFHYVLDALEQYAMVGAFKRYGQFTTPENHRWHYSGTFYWFRNDEVFRASKDWAKLDNAFFCVESWPGRMFGRHETTCILGDDVGDLYKDQSWPKVHKELEFIKKCKEI